MIGSAQHLALIPMGPVIPYEEEAEAPGPLPSSS